MLFLSTFAHGLCPSKFEWQDEYFAASVSASIVKKRREYIKNQELPQHLKSYAEEQKDFSRI